MLALGGLGSARLAAATPAPATTPATASASARPNFMIVIADDLTHRDLGCYGGQAYTPAIDALAQEGMRFERCFQAAPICSPTRHCLYTGMYPVKTGAYPNHTFVSRPNTVSLVQRLNAVGYRVALAGKRHINPATVFPFEYLRDPIDFDEVGSFLGSCREQGRPFCLVVASHLPHSPWTEGDRARYDAAKLRLFPVWADTPATRADYRNYLAEVTEFDRQVAQSLAVLERAGVAAQTAVIMLSEQGTSQARAKWNLYDLGIQSGCVVRWPGVVRPGSVTSALIEYVDVVPTLLEAAGGAITPDLDGRSFLGVLRGAATRHKDYIYAVYTNRGVINGSDHYGIRCVRSERYKYIWNFTPQDPYANASLHNATFRSWREAAEQGNADARAAIQRYLQRAEIELYDVAADPFELRNLAGDPQLAAVQADLRAHLDAWMRQQGDLGQATEMAALEHLAKNAPDEEVRAAPKGKKKGAKKGKS